VANPSVFVFMEYIRIVDIFGNLVPFRRIWWR